MLHFYSRTEILWQKNQTYSFVSHHNLSGGREDDGGLVVLLDVAAVVVHQRIRQQPCCPEIKNVCHRFVKHLSTETVYYISNY